MNSRLALLIIVLASPALADAPKPQGRFLFQPMLIWGTSEVTHQGTGYLIEHAGSIYGVTSVHFMNFEAGGLFEAIWTDIHTSRPVVGFRTSVGRPATTEMARFIDVQHDFLLMRADRLPEGTVALHLDETDFVEKGTKLWFPNKSDSVEVGYESIEAEVLEDKKHMLNVRLLKDVALQSQSGSPFLSQLSGKVVGMLMGANEEGGETVIYLCLARGLRKRLSESTKAIPLMQSIRKG